MSDLLDFLSVLGQITSFIGELATCPSFPNSIWERNCPRNFFAPSHGLRRLPRIK
jgi:hypothetical protein